MANPHDGGTQSPAPGGTGDDALRGLAAVADHLGAARLTRDALALAERVAEGRFHVACVGQFKRGKSSLVNALLGDAIVPTGVVPVTALPTVVRYGAVPSARVMERDGCWRAIAADALVDYVSEERNPENRRGVALVEVFVPAPLLATGMCLVDTPGLGSVFGHNAESTRAFIPHIDAAIVAIGADPPISGDELRLVEDVAREVPHLLVVMNKADRVSEADGAVAAAFAQRVLAARLGRPAPPIFAVSAAERLAHAGPPRDWDAFVAALRGVARDDGRALVTGAAERGRARSAHQLLAILAEERRALQRPLAESERRVARLERTVEDAEQWLGELRIRMGREQHRIARRMDARCDEFLTRALPAGREALGAALREVRRRHGPAYRREAMARAQSVVRDLVMPWLADEEPVAASEYQAAAAHFAAMANGFIERLAEERGDEGALLPDALDTEQILRAPPRFHFHELLRLTQPASPLRWLSDVALGLAGARRIIARETDAFLVRSLALNAARVRNDLEQRVSESRRTLEAEIRMLMREVAGVAARALDSARRAREDGEAAVSRALARVAGLEATVRALGGAPDTRPAPELPLEAAAPQDAPPSRNPTSSPAT